MSAAGYVLTLKCPDRPGVVHAVSGFLLGHGCTIVESQQFNDRDAGTFFMRVEFESVDNSSTMTTLRTEFATVSEQYSMEWRLLDGGRPQRVLIMVSRFGHCLNDLLFRAHHGGLNVEIAAVVSNHPDLSYLFDDQHSRANGLHLALGRDSGRPADILEIDGRVTPEHASQLEETIWRRLPDLRPLRADQFGDYQDEAQVRHSDPLALTQLFLTYHLLREHSSVQTIFAPPVAAESRVLLASGEGEGSSHE